MKKRSKIAAIATAIFALAVPATANAAQTMSIVSGPSYSDTYNDTSGVYRYTTEIVFEASNGWHPTTNCTTSNVFAGSGNTWSSELNATLGVGNYTKSVTFKKIAPTQIEVIWSESNTQGVGVGVANATVSCAMTKVTSTVKITHPLVWKSFSVHRSGTNTSSRSHSGSCYIDGYSGELHLDCWGGNYAQANYSFALPRDARYIHRSISTRAGCCSYGSGYNRKYWSGNTAIVRSTGWHGIYVRGVTISYQHRVRTTKRTTIHTTLHATGIGQF